MDRPASDNLGQKSPHRYSWDCILWRSLLPAVKLATLIYHHCYGLRKDVSAHTETILFVFLWHSVADSRCHSRVGNLQPNKERYMLMSHCFQTDVPSNLFCCYLIFPNYQGFRCGAKAVCVMQASFYAAKVSKVIRPISCFLICVIFSRKLGNFTPFIKITYEIAYESIHLWGITHP